MSVVRRTKTKPRISPLKLTRSSSSSGEGSYPSRDARVECDVCGKTIRKRKLQEHQRTQTCQRAAHALARHGLRPSPSAEDGDDAMMMLVDGRFIGETALALVKSADLWERSVGPTTSGLTIWDEIKAIAERALVRRRTYPVIEDEEKTRRKRQPSSQLAVKDVSEEEEDEDEDEDAAVQEQNCKL